MLALCHHCGCAGGVFDVVTDATPLRDWRVIRSPCRRPLNVAPNVAPRTVWFSFGFFPWSLFLVPWSCLLLFRVIRLNSCNSWIVHPYSTTTFFSPWSFNSQFAICNLQLAYGVLASLAGSALGFGGGSPALTSAMRNLSREASENTDAALGPSRPARRRGK